MRRRGRRPRPIQHSGRRPRPIQHRGPGSQRLAKEILERRYRRLLALYPSDYRAAYADEMLGVALALSSPGQRRPGLGEAVSLIVSGIGKRMGGPRAGYRNPAWRDAGAVVAIIGPIMLATFSARDVVGGMTGWGVFPMTLTPRWSALASAAGWAMVAGTAICGRCGISLGLRPRRWREAAAVGACIGAAGQAIVLGREYSGNPSGLVSSWWELVFAVVIALSALVAVQSEGRPLSWRTIVPIAITGAAIAAYPAVIAATTNVTSFPDGSSTSSSPFFGISGVLDYGLLAAGGIAVLVTIGRCRPEAPLTPLAVFTAGLFWLRRHERFLSALSAK